MKLNRSRLAIAIGILLGAALSVGIGYVAHVPAAHASPLSQIPRAVLAIRNHPFGQFESAQGAPVYLGTIDVTNTSKTNAQATTPFNNTGADLCNKVLLVQNSGTVDARIAVVTTSTGTVSTTRGAGFGPTLGAGERAVIYMPDPSMSAGCFLAAISTTAAAENVDVWSME